VNGWSLTDIWKTDIGEVKLRVLGSLGDTECRRILACRNGLHWFGYLQAVDREDCVS